MQRNKNVLSKGSSLIATTPGLILWGALAAVCLWQRLGILAWLFLFLLLLGGAARWWGSRSIRQVEIGIECARTQLFPGQTTTLTYTVQNGKAIPLPWLEISQDAPLRDCLMPEEGFERYVPMGAEGRASPRPALRQTIPYVGGWETLRRDTCWTARRRGVYDLRGLVARSGDGFGLVQRERSLPDGSFPVLAVYPRRVEVELEFFLRDQWRAASGGNGWMEDNTVLQGNRDYQPGDNWKHINWRMAARGQGIQVNLYQHIRPRQMHFLLDGESFCQGEGKADGTFPLLEETLEILSSVVIGLATQGAVCRLTVPQSRYSPARTVETEAGDPGPLLFCLAGYEPQHIQRQEEGFEPSRFSSHIPIGEESCYLFTESGDCLPEGLLQQLDINRLWILCRRNWETALALGYCAASLEQLSQGVGCK